MAKKPPSMSKSIQALKRDASNIQSQLHACKVGPDSQHMRNSVQNCTDAYERVARLLEKTDRTSARAKAFRDSTISIQKIFKKLLLLLRRISHASILHFKWAAIGDSQARELCHELERHTSHFQELIGLLEESVPSDEEVSLDRYTQLSSAQVHQGYQSTSKQRNRKKNKKKRASLNGPRWVFLITRLLAQSNTRYQNGHSEQIPHRIISAESYISLTESSKSSVATEHWGILVSQESNIFDGSVFELQREGEYSTLGFQKGDMLKQSFQGVPLWRLKRVGLTHLGDTKIEEYAKAAIHKVGETYNILSRNCQVFAKQLVPCIQTPTQKNKILAGLQDAPYHLQPEVLKRRCHEWVELNANLKSSMMAGRTESWRLPATTAEIVLPVARVICAALVVAVVAVAGAIDQRWERWIVSVLLFLVGWLSHYAKVHRIQFTKTILSYSLRRRPTNPPAELWDKLIDRVNNTTIGKLREDYAGIRNEVIVKLLP
ncbi:hypothetical protein CFE70_006252 [Pyrenophora teres f. teres 0-1]|uniref:PPPDE domain-containing protein n=1 Tax=Pyrenophora teres f. teres (strain 0-1) TaxID=861557 RepID=E3RR81_PYRTT|nr:hypothetical protein PTT_11293 [Pyrenophora teres f. teres 0-1]KAE8827871.1 hypothetical protein HRS9139_07090 [Pyrenophora teres f. teres]